MLALLALSACGPHGASDSGDTETRDTAVETGTTASCVDGELREMDGITFARVCARTFDMGCTPGAGACTADEPLHAVTLTHDVWVQTTETTQAQVKAWNPSFNFAFPTCGTDGDPDWAGLTPDCPAELIDWNRSAQFANALSAQAGLTSCYTCSGDEPNVECSRALTPTLCDGYRLLTEAEWEAAARCGEDFPYAGSASAAAVAWTSDNAGRSTHPVAQLTPNACGLFDMSGNVFEWTQDGYGPLTTDAATDPAGSVEYTYRVIRGGTWYSDPSISRVALRSYNYPDFTNYRVGLRLARTEM